MPATERAFGDPAPLRLYLDTNVVFDYLIPSRPHHGRVDAFVLRLFAEGLTTLYVSPLSWMEFVFVVGKPSFHQGLPAAWQSRYTLAQWSNLAVRQRFLTDMLGRFEALLNQFAWDEVTISKAARVHALWLIATYGLKPQDALHVACALEAGVADFASFDADLVAVDAINLWNDRVGHP